MPPTFIPAPSFVVVSTPDDADFEADLDIPEGDALLADHPTHSASPSKPRLSSRMASNDDEEDWDREFDTSPQPSRIAALQPIPSSSKNAHIGSITNLTSRKAKNVTLPETENWDDDEDLDLPPPSSRPLKLSLSPRTKARMDSNRSSGAFSWGAGDDDESGEVSTIKLSSLPFMPLPGPNTISKASKRAMFPVTDEDMEDGFDLPDEIAHLSLKPPQTLSHRLSKASLDPWGDTTSTSSLYSESSTLSNPSHSSACNSQPETEDDDDFGDDGDLDGLLLPDSLSPDEMKKKLENKKKEPVFFDSRVKVASPDGEDDFEIGLEFGGDEDLSSNKLKGVVSARAVGKGTIRSHSAPSKTSTSEPKLDTTSSSSGRPSSRTASLLPSDAGRTSRNGVSPVPPPAPSSNSNKPKDTFPSLRRLPSSISTIGRQPPTRHQTLSTLLPPSISTQPSSSNYGPTLMSPSSATSTSPLPPSPPQIKHQKSFSRFQTRGTTTSSSSKKLGRKASLSSLVDTVSSAASSTYSPSPSPEMMLNPKRTLTRPSTITHAASFRDLGRAATAGPSSSKPRGYDAPTAASRAKHIRGEPDYGTISGSDRERDRLNVATTSGSRSKSRQPVFNIFPSIAATTSGSSTQAPSMRSTSPLTTTNSSSSRRVQSVSIAPASSPPPIQAPKFLKRPKKSKIFGDGTELDGFEDLAVEREKESKFRVVPKGTSSGLGRKSGSSSSPSGVSIGPSGTIGRKRGTVTASNTYTQENVGPKRPGSSASSQGSLEPPRFIPTLRRKQTLDISKAVEMASSSSSSMLTSGRRKRDSNGTPGGINKRKPTLIRNLGSAGAPKVVGDMKWNPQLLRWEGNDSILRDFDSSSSSRPALITQLTGSSVGALSPSGSFSALANGAKVVGDMLFDPIRMCWVNQTGDEEDAFAGIDDDDEDWDADGKGGTIRAVIQTISGGVTLGSGLRRESGIESGVSSNEGSPGRSSIHARSASESDSESVTGSAGAPATSGRESSLSGMATGLMSMIEEDSASFSIPRDLLAACLAAEERHRQEMKGWTSRGASSRRGGSSTPDDVGRTHLWDIRSLATRNS